MIKLLLTKLIRGYQYFISPMFPSRCRFYPTCSEYAIEAIALHGSVKGSWLAVKRLSKCHPLGPSGLDPVPGTEHLYPELARESGELGESKGDINNAASGEKVITGCGCGRGKR